MRNIRFVLALFLILTFYGCRHDSQVSEMRNVNVNFSDAEKIVMDSKDILWFENSDSSLISDITNLCPIGDSAFVVQSRGSILKLFDRRGKYLRDMATQGEGPGEFNWVGNVWSEDTVFHLFDGMLGRDFKYGLKSGFIGYDTVVSSPIPDKGGLPRICAAEIYPRPDGKGIYYINGFLGTPPFRQRFAYAKDLNSKPDSISGRLRLDGSTFWNDMYLVGNGERALYWEAIKDTVYTVTPDTVVASYAINYGENSLPAEITALTDIADRFQAIPEEDKEKYVIFARYFQTYDGWIYYITSVGMQGYIVGIDEESGNAKAWEFVSPEGQQLLPQLFFRIDGDKGMLSVIDESKPDNNPGLFVFPMSRLK